MYRHILPKTSTPTRPSTSLHEITSRRPHRIVIIRRIKTSTGIQQVLKHWKFYATRLGRWRLRAPVWVRYWFVIPNSHYRSDATKLLRRVASGGVNWVGDSLRQSEHVQSKTVQFTPPRRIGDATKQFWSRRASDWRCKLGVTCMTVIDDGGGVTSPWRHAEAGERSKVSVNADAPVNNRCRWRWVACWRRAPLASSPAAAADDESSSAATVHNTTARQQYRQLRDSTSRRRGHRISRTRATNACFQPRRIRLLSV